MVYSGSNGTAVASANLNSLMSCSDSEVWELLTGTAYNSKPTSSQVSESQMSQRMETITIPRRTDSGDSTINITVNSALTELFTAFYTEIYNTCPDFYINDTYCYEYRAVSGSRSGALSAHSFGAAVDINAGYNPQGVTPPQRLSDVLSNRNYVIYAESPIITIAKKYTLCWGGYFSSNKDGMHFSFIGDWTRARTMSEYST